MACYFPTDAYQREGKGRLLWHCPDESWRLVRVPCGGCVGCRLERARQWAVRCMHEAALYSENCVVTLTYDEEKVPAGGSLEKSAFPLFMKRLRKELKGKRVRYYYCGEYGDRFGRPHYHALLFGHDFEDKYAWSHRNGYAVWRSPVLEKLWRFGISETTELTPESIAYVARYVVKKLDQPQPRDGCHVDGDGVLYPDRVAEFTGMSRGRKPDGGIGARWLERFRDETYPADGVVVDGKLRKPPRFYDMRMATLAPDVFELVREKRRQARRLEDERPERLAAREKVARAQVALKKGR